MQHQNETRRCGGAGLAKISSLTRTSSESTTAHTAINHLRARFGFSEPVANLYAALAGLGPREARS